MTQVNYHLTMENATENIEPWMIAFAQMENEIRQALKHSGDTHTVEDVFIGIAQGSFQFWRKGESVGITEIVNYPRTRQLNIFLAAGKMEDMKTTLPEIEEYARKQKCKSITLLGRKGWARSFLKDEGYAAPAQLLVKDL